MGTQEVHIKEVLSWFIFFVRLIMPVYTRNFGPALAALIGPGQNIFFITEII